MFAVVRKVFAYRYFYRLFCRANGFYGDYKDELCSRECVYPCNSSDTKTLGYVVGFTQTTAQRRVWGFGG